MRVNPRPQLTALASPTLQSLEELRGGANRQLQLELGRGCKNLRDPQLGSHSQGETSEMKPLATPQGHRLPKDTPQASVWGCGVACFHPGLWELVRSRAWGRPQPPPETVSQELSFTECAQLWPQATPL